ncbi:PadR family transcriptional regulator [Nocardioides daphniae]|uniref:PadR family transcriptional regulator n=1 Tax=Nocardioides daphniae TaxID=402297 RepID=A0A4P7UAA0_9ACTN|nr:PadR family transcriptional regulator [Nocardioides daphniae]QCC76168.1 PadR family transcriptional regulator [Nocardioides daphniae]GGD09402.1 PadR family transcriptional regulator [Nocardioides daphniae]
MALEHALLVALSEKPGSGLELTRRFERSFGYFWHATHQQIYRVLARMVDDGDLDVEVVAQSGRPDKKVYRVTEAGRGKLAAWLATPTPMEPLRSDLAVKMRGASYGDREEVLAALRANLVDHRVRLEHYLQLAKEYDLDDAERATGGPLPDPVRDQYLVLRGGIRLEEFWIGWIGDYLAAHGQGDPR